MKKIIKIKSLFVILLKTNNIEGCLLLPNLPYNVSSILNNTLGNPILLINY